MRAAVGSLQFPDAPDDLDVTISIGMALFDGNRCHDIGSWLHAADEAMYAAKARGRDQIVVAQEVDQMLSHFRAVQH
jgi:diguanylate cyclase (GGDEF)-like protein